MPKRIPRRTTKTKEVFDSAYRVVIEGINLYKKIKPIIKKHKGRKKNNDKSIS
jgi:hypothetical protein